MNEEKKQKRLFLATVFPIVISVFVNKTKMTRILECF